MAIINYLRGCVSIRPNRNDSTESRESSGCPDLSLVKVVGLPEPIRGHISTWDIWGGIRITRFISCCLSPSKSIVRKFFALNMY